MNESTTKPRAGQRIHRSGTEIRELLSEYETSRGAMSVSEFCELYDIGESTFYGWQRRFGQGGDADSGNFIPLDSLLEGSGPPAGCATFSITLEDGRIFRYHGAVDAAFLRELLGLGGVR